LWLYTQRPPFGDRDTTYRLTVELPTGQEIPCDGVEALVQAGFKIESKEAALRYVRFIRNNGFFRPTPAIHVLDDGHMVGDSGVYVEHIGGVCVELDGVSPEAIAPTLTEMIFPWGAREFHIRRYALPTVRFTNEAIALRSVTVVNETVTQDGSYRCQLSKIRESDPPGSEWHLRFRGARCRCMLMVPGRPFVLAGRSRRAEPCRGSGWH
jgi:hypothetical protein